MNAVSFSNKLTSMVQALPKDLLTIILGDFNFDLAESTSYNIVQLMKQLGFHQHVKTPTTDYGSLLDHVYINRQHHISVDIVDIIILFRP